MKLVIVESPYGSEVPSTIKQNVAYARAALRDCLLRGEAPYASHLLYTQPGVLRDEVADERQHGIEAGLQWKRAAEATIVYVDRGVSKGMALGIVRARQLGQAVEYRALGPPWSPTLDDITIDGMPHRRGGDAVCNCAGGIWNNRNACQKCGGLVHNQPAYGCIMQLCEDCDDAWRVAAADLLPPGQEAEYERKVLNFWGLEILQQ